MGMTQTRDGSRLLLEPLPTRWMTVGLGVQHLNRDRTVQTRVTGPEDFAHSPGSEKGLDFIGTNPYTARDLHRSIWLSREFVNSLGFLYDSARSGCHITRSDFIRHADLPASVRDQECRPESLRRAPRVNSKQKRKKERTMETKADVGGDARHDCGNSAPGPLRWCSRSSPSDAAASRPPTCRNATLLLRHGRERRARSVTA